MGIKILKTKIKDLLELKLEPFSDKRGKFFNIYRDNDDVFRKIWESRKIAQINISRTRSKGIVRGLHYQNQPYSEAKLIKCIKGLVWDVAVDLRLESKTYGQWHSIELSEDNSNFIFIPEGFAHGFQALKANSELIYLHSQNWVKKSEAGIRFDDPYLNIKWPLKPKCISSRDLSLPYLKNK